MTLAAAQVVDAVAARITGLPTAGLNIFTSRAWPIADTQLPAGRVLAVDEDIAPITVHSPSIQRHALQIELHGAVRQVENVDDEMHDLAAEWLSALFDTTPPADALNTIGSKILLTQRRIERMPQTEGQAALGLIVITLRAEFKTLASDPHTIIN
jgi:hypothetical protein